MSIYTIAYIQNSCIHIVANMVHKVINFTRSVNKVQLHQQPKYHVQIVRVFTK